MLHFNQTAFVHVNGYVTVLIPKHCGVACGAAAFSIMYFQKKENDEQKERT